MRNVALLTDFGPRDPYVAAMKGVLASRTPAAIHDLTHEIAAFDVFAAAWFLRDVAPWWSETVFVCVVDPGVGTARRILAMRTGGNVFLAPDNGLLHFVGVAPAASAAEDDPRLRPTSSGHPGAPLGRDTVSVENEAFFLPHGSTTFHGRDRFAPVAAAIANGTPLEELGPRVDDLVRLDYTEPSYQAHVVRGTIVSIDRFGNLITDISRERMPFARFRMGDIDRLETTYSGEGAFFVIGSTGCVEISMAGASAAAHLGLKRFDRVELCDAS